MTQKNIKLSKYLSAFIKHSVPVKVGSEAYRIIVGILSHYPNKNQLIKDYFVWVTSEYLEDKVKKGNSINDAEIFALDFVKTRFVNEGNNTPKEDGVSCSKNIVQYVNPKTFFHPEEK